MFHKDGQLIKHKFRKRYLTRDELFILLYVDDAAIFFTSRNDAILGTNVIFREVIRLGLNMYRGIGKKTRKWKMHIFLQDRKFNHGLRIIFRI